MAPAIVPEKIVGKRRGYAISTAQLQQEEEPQLQVLERQIHRVRAGQVSQNGNPYTALEFVNTPRVYVWNRAWRREIEHNAGGYFYLDATLYVRDHSSPADDEEEPFYWLEAVVPQNTALAKRFLERWKQTNRYELFDAADRCRRKTRQSQE